MEQRIISKTATQCIYFMKETNLDFYLIIPNSKQVSLVLGLFPDVTEEIVKNLPTEQDKAIVIPVISNQILTSANHLDATGFKYLDSVFSFLINVSYKILTSNNLLVNQKILLNNHSAYANFNQKYIEKYQGRVELYNIVAKTTPQPLPNTPIFTPVSTPAPDQQPFKPVDPPFQPKPQTNTSTDVMEENIDPILYDEPVLTSPDKQENKEPGFISYVLLGVLVAVILLVALYMIL